MSQAWGIGPCFNNLLVFKAKDEDTYSLPLCLIKIVFTYLKNKIIGAKEMKRKDVNPFNLRI